MDNVKKFWTAIGAQEPHYGVLTDTRFRKETLPENADDFFASGRAEVARFERFLRASAGIEDFAGFLRGRPVADIGSGVGRVASAISGLCGTVYCIDIAQSYLDTLPETDNFVKVLSSNSDDSFRVDEKCRLVYSVITFQHNPPDEIRNLVRKACRILADDGVALLHIPSRCLVPHKVRDECVMQMNFLPEAEIERAANFQGCRVIGKHPMNSSGSSFEDYMFVLRRASDRKNVL